MSPLPLSPEVTGHPDGFALRWGGEVVEVFPSLLGAIAGRLACYCALAELAECLAAAPSNTNRKAA